MTPRTYSISYRLKDGILSLLYNGNREVTFGPISEYPQMGIPDRTYSLEQLQDLIGTSHRLAHPVHPWRTTDVMPSFHFLFGPCFAVATNGIHTLLLSHIGDDATFDVVHSTQVLPITPTRDPAPTSKEVKMERLLALL